jgi:serine/threonine-protein kinase
MQRLAAVTAETRTEFRPERLGPFRVLRRLASGGGRDVFLAEDGGRRRVVLKVVGVPWPDAAPLDPRIVEEARSYARLSHPNLVKVVDVFFVDGAVTIALEHVEGSTLDVVRAALAQTQSTIDDPCWIYVAASVFAGLEAAHSAKDAAGEPAPILHRNINPTNVYVAWDGAIKLGDFGVTAIAHAMHDSNPGLTWGSYGYFAPEQTGPMPIGPHTDVYSVMLVLWELLAGRKAVERGVLSQVELLDLMAAPNIPPLETLRPDVDPRIAAAVRAGLEPDPEKRTMDAASAGVLLRSSADLDAARERFASALSRIRADGTRASGTHAISSETPTPPAPTPTPTPPSEREPAPPRATPPPLPRPERVETTVDTQPESTSVGPTSRSAAVGRKSTSRRRRPFPKRGAVTLVGCLALAGAALFARYQAAPDTPDTSAERLTVAEPPDPPALARSIEALPAPSVAEPTPPPGVASAAPIEATIPPDVGELRPPAYADGHRIYVDERVVGEGTAPIRVRCGRHSVRVGSAGRLQHLDVPCGDALALTR